MVCVSRSSVVRLSGIGLIACEVSVGSGSELLPGVGVSDTGAGLVSGSRSITGIGVGVGDLTSNPESRDGLFKMFCSCQTPTAPATTQHSNRPTAVARMIIVFLDKSLCSGSSKSALPGLGSALNAGKHLRKARYCTHSGRSSLH